MQYGQQHGQSILLKTHGNAPWVTEVTRIDEGLNFNQQGASALPDDHNHRARRWRIGPLQENGRRIQHFLEPGICHRKHA